MLANRATPDAFAFDALANRHLHLEHKVGLGRAAAIRDL